MFPNMVAKNYLFTRILPNIFPILGMNCSFKWFWMQRKPLRVQNFCVWLISTKRKLQCKDRKNRLAFCKLLAPVTSALSTICFHSSYPNIYHSCYSEYVNAIYQRASLEWNRMSKPYCIGQRRLCVFTYCSTWWIIGVRLIRPWSLWIKTEACAICANCAEICQRDCGENTSLQIMCFNQTDR